MPCLIELLCVQVLVHRLRKYLGAYLMQLADCKDVCIVFSGGIGENSAIIRSKTLQGLEVCICTLDSKNDSHKRRVNVTLLYFLYFYNCIYVLCDA